MQQGTNLVQLTAIWVIVVVLLVGCSGSRFVSYGEGRYSSHNKNRVHVVRKGETLYSIAWQYGYDYRKLAGWNNIAVPYTIFPRQEIKLYNRQRATAIHQPPYCKCPFAGLVRVVF